MPFCRRAKAIRMKLESCGDKRPDASMCKHIARRMLPSLKLCSDHVLLLPDLSSRTMEDLLRRAAHELARNGRYGEESEEMRHALVAAGVGRGDRAGRNAGDRGNDGRVPGRTRSEGRQLSAVPEEDVSTPLPEATSFDHGVGLLSHAGEDVLLSLCLLYTSPSPRD